MKIEDTRHHLDGGRPLEPDDVEAFADDVLKRLDRQRRSRRRNRLMAVAAVALMGLAWWSTPSSTLEAPPPVMAQVEDDRVLASTGAQFALSGPREDRLVELEDGRVFCEVDKRGAGERFRVVVGEAVVEVTGTRFAVTADAGTLRAVWVEEGRVEVRESGQLHVLLAGDRWPPIELDTGPEPTPTPTPTATPAPPPPTATATAVPTPTPTPTPTATPVPTPTVGERLRTGMVLFDRGDFAAAAAAFADEATQPPLREDAMFWRALSLQAADHPEMAVPAMRSFLATYPSSSRADQIHCLLGQALAKGGQTQAAQGHFSAAAGSTDPAVARCGRSGL